MTPEHSEHDWFTEQIAAYLADGLSEAERGRFEAHAATCESCAQNLNEMREMETTMSDLFSPAIPAPDFEDRLLERLRMNVDSRIQVNPKVRRAAVAAAAVIVMGALGFYGQQFARNGALPSFPTLSIKRLPLAQLNEGIEHIFEGRPSPSSLPSGTTGGNEVFILPVKPGTATELERRAEEYYGISPGQARGIATSNGVSQNRIGGVGIGGATMGGLSKFPADVPPASPVPMVVADPNTDTLIVTTTPEKWNDVKAKLNELGGGEVQTRYSYKQEAPYEVATSGGSLTSNQNRGAFPRPAAVPVTSADDRRSNTIGTGSPQQMKEIEELVESLDSDGDKSTRQRDFLKDVGVDSDVVANGGNLWNKVGTASLQNGALNYTQLGALSTSVPSEKAKELADNTNQSLGRTIDQFSFYANGDAAKPSDPALGGVTSDARAFKPAEMFTKAGAGTLVLAGGNAHTGVTTVNSGTLSLNGGGVRIVEGAKSPQNVASGTHGISTLTGVTFGDNSTVNEFKLNYSNATDAARAINELYRTGDTYAQGQAYDPNAPATQPTTGNSRATGVVQQVTPSTTAPAAVVIRKVIREGVMEFEVDNFDSTFNQITRITAEEGGFVSAADSDKLPNGKVKGTITVRVPPDHLDLLVLKLRALGELKSQKLGSKDISKQYTDLESEIRAAKAMELRLLELIAKGTGEVKDLLAAEKELGTWRTKIETIQGQMNYYNNLVSMATLTVTAYEKDIRQPASADQTEEISAGIETEDVETARTSALAAVSEAKGRIVESTLQKLEAGQFTAKIVAEVAPENAGPLVDRLRQLGRVARLDIQRKQTPTQAGNPAPPNVQIAKVEQQPTRIIVSMYNLANVAPRLTTNLNLAADDVETVYRAILTRITQAEGRVVSSSLNRQDALNAVGNITFEVKASVADAVANDVRNGTNRQVLRLTVAENPDTANVTTAKQAFTVQIIPASQVPPRETRSLSVETSDVETAVQNLTNAVSTSGGRVIESSLSQAGSGRTEAHLSVEVPLDKTDSVVDSAKRMGKVRTADSSKNAQIPEGPLARSRINLTIGTTNSIVPAEGGLWHSLREGLSTSVQGLLWSLQLIVIGLCLVAPWMLLIWVAWKMARRRKRPATA